MAEPVILKMNVHCGKCATRIRRAIKNMHGVEKVWASPETGLVIVTGTADALALRWRLWLKIRRSATVVSDGTPERIPPEGGMTHLAPAPAYAVPPYYTWGATPPMHGAPYVAAAPAGYLYCNQLAPVQYVPRGTPARFVDDDGESPHGCCSVQ
uniref:HMA domain-containing protein n=1 Tax=Oryza brachyantha TaxID=4533 RepID=J3LUE7_ORYBR